MCAVASDLDVQAFLPRVISLARTPVLLPYKSTQYLSGGPPVTFVLQGAVGSAVVFALPHRLSELTADVCLTEPGMKPSGPLKSTAKLLLCSRRARPAALAATRARYVCTYGDHGSRADHGGLQLDRNNTRAFKMYTSLGWYQPCATNFRCTRVARVAGPTVCLLHVGGKILPKTISSGNYTNTSDRTLTRDTVALYLWHALNRCCVLVSRILLVFVFVVFLLSCSACRVLSTQGAALQG